MLQKSLSNIHLGYEKDDAIISDLEKQLMEHNSNTQAMKDFINSQIDIAELKADQQLETLRQRYQKMAFEDAIRCTSPGKSLTSPFTMAYVPCLV